MRRLFLLLAFLFLLPVAAQAQGREYILLVGGPSLNKWEKFKAEPHDIFWGSFVRAARTRVEQLRMTSIPAGSADTITMLIYRKGYITRGQQDGRDYIALINTVRDTYKINLVWFTSGAEVFNYLNGGKPRSSTKIMGFEFYGHSNSKCFMFDYSNEIDSCSKSWWHEDELTRLARTNFTRDAIIKSWGCHTGESMSQKFYAATGSKMIGAIGKTTYTNRISNQDGILNGIIPVISTGGGRWTD